MLSRLTPTRYPFATNHQPDVLETLLELNSNHRPVIRQLFRAKNAALRYYDHYRTIDNKIRLRNLQTEVKKRIEEFRHYNWDNLLEDIKPTKTAFWQSTLVLKAEQSSPMPPLIIPGKPDLAFDDSEKAECLADSLESQCTPSSKLTAPAHLAEVEAEVKRKSALPPVDDFLDPGIADEITEVIKSLKKKLAHSPDGINNSTEISLHAARLPPSRRIRSSF